MILSAEQRRPLAAEREDADDVLSINHGLQRRFRKNSYQDCSTSKLRLADVNDEDDNNDVGCWVQQGKLPQTTK
jgi:hypothetical protein